MKPILEDQEVTDDEPYASEGDTKGSALIRGVVYGRSIRAGFCSLHLARQLDDEAPTDDDYEPMIVRIQFDHNHAVVLRSHCRRTFKNGDLFEFRVPAPTRKEEVEDEDDERLVLDLKSVEHATQTISCMKSNFWSMTQWQSWQRKYLPSKDERPTKKPKLPSKDSHASGLSKREQGDYMANFLIHTIMHSLDPIRHAALVLEENWASTDVRTLPNEYHDLRSVAVERLNQGTGVVDAAGGSGHVSMALGMRGVQSTVVDPRGAVGSLPGRDRKVWKRALKGDFCVPYETVQAWLGMKPENQSDDIPVFNDDNTLIEKCSAIVGLHPDAATEAIVVTAVRRRVPFVTVPCCVFARQFPSRYLPGSKQVVSSRDELIAFLESKDPTIRRTNLPFLGANVALWSTFPDTSTSP